MTGDVEHEERGDRGGFFITRGGERIAEMTYRRVEPQFAVIDHTEVIPELRGRGVARQLFDAAVQWARDHNIRLDATCSYAIAQIKRMS